MRRKMARTTRKKRMEEAVAWAQEKRRLAFFEQHCP
jgi:hypothetical protein